jgi:hypothetical protein
MEVTVGIQEEFRVYKRRSKFLLGLAGKQKSGKTTLAWALAGHYDAVVAPFASAIKGGVSYYHSLLAFRPQWVSEVRRRLQDCGMEGRSLLVQGDLWIRCWQANFGDLPRCVIPDVRFPNEVEFVRSKGGKVIYLNYVGAPYDPHPSEQLAPQSCDYVVEVTDENRGWVLKQVLDYLRNFFGDPTFKPRVYIGGNIHGERQYEETFLALEKMGREFGFEPLVPLDATNREKWSRLVQEQPFPIASRELVVGDISLISRSHAALFWLEKPSIGSAMEIICAAMNERPVVVVTPHLELFYHPWLQAFARVIWSADPTEGWKYLHFLFFPTS